MKVLLSILSAEPTSRYGDYVNAPYAIGLAYIYSVLEKQGHEVKLLSLSNHAEEFSDKEFFECFATFQPQVVGFQIFSSNRVSTFRCIEKLHKNSPQTPIIIGGIHTSVMYEQIIEKYPYVVAVIGEGELTINELVTALELKTRLETVKGIAFFKDGKVIQTEPSELINDLDSIPFPKHEVFFENEPDRIAGSVFTSRGCPSRCSFCCLKVISKRLYRKRNIIKVVDEIKYLKQKYPRLKEVQLLDDTFLLDNLRVIEFCKMIIELDLGLTFKCSARVKPVTSEMFYWMEKAGFVLIMFGLETGSEKMLKSIHKDITRKDIINLFKTLKPFKFVVVIFIMCGFPGENDDTVRESTEFIQTVQKMYYSKVVGVGKLMVYPGTEVYDIMKKSNHIKDDFWLTENPIPYYTVDHDVTKLIEYENYIMDRVGIDKILTISGFKNHFLKMPIVVIKHIFQHKEILPAILSTSVKLYFPKIHPIASKIYRKNI
ncbi:MAG: radical SAM protein [bacterium]